MNGPCSAISPRSVVIALLVSTAFIAARCSPEPEPKPEPPPRPNFVLVVVDALRADRLHFAGYERKITPNFDALRAEGLHRAFAGVTLPNPASVALHRKLGFREVGIFDSAGRKFERWWSVQWFELHLDGASQRETSVR